MPMKMVNKKSPSKMQAFFHVLLHIDSDMDVRFLLTDIAIRSVSIGFVMKTTNLMNRRRIG